MKTIDYLDAIRVKYGCSDYKASKLLGVSKQQVSNYRNGLDGFGEAAAIRAAELLDTDPARVIVDTLAERAKTAQGRAILQRVAESLRTNAAAAVLAAPFVFGALPHMDEAQAATAPGTGAGLVSSNVYYVKFRRRPRKLPKAV